MAISSGTISGISAGIGDIFAASADKSKAQFDLTEGQEYSEAAALAGQNEQFTQMSTAIKEAQQSRQIAMGEGATEAGVAGAGFAKSGSALDIMRSNAQQGALQQAVTGQQGLITEAGYQEQQASYTLMAGAANTAASAEETAAKDSDIMGAIDIGGSILTAALPSGGIPLPGGG
jgi:hypothetical protein